MSLDSFDKNCYYSLRFDLSFCDEKMVFFSDFFVNIFSFLNERLEFHLTF